MAFPNTLLPMRSEIFINGAWTNITSRVERDNGNGVKITSRGRRNEATKPVPATAAFRLKNSDDYFSYKKPTSVNYGILGPNTPFRQRLMWAEDLFDRTAASSWGNMTSGNAWSVSGGLASDYSVSGGKGIVTLTSVSVSRTVTMTPPVRSNDAAIIVDTSAVATGGDLGARLMLGSGGTANGYYAWVFFKTTGSVTVQIVRVVASTGTTIVAAQTVGTYIAGTQYYLRIKRNQAGYICVMCRPLSQAEGAWTMVSPTPETQHTNLDRVIVLARAETGNTNVNPQIRFAKFELASYRFYGEIPTWEPSSDDTGLYKWVDVQAGDAQRHYTVGAKRLKSAMYATVSGITAGDLVPVAYWPFEDANGATVAASATSGVDAAVTAGTVGFGSYTGVVGSDPLPVFGTDGFLSGRYPTLTGLTTASVWQLQFIMMIPSAPASAGTLAEFTMLPSTNNTCTRMQIYYDPAFPGSEINLNVYADTTLLGSANLSATSFFGFNFGTPYMFAITQYNTGGNVNTVFGQYDPAITEAMSAIALRQQTSVAWGGATSVPNNLKAWSFRSYGAANGMVYGHHSAYYDPSILTVSNVSNNTRGMDGHAGERSGARLLRFGQENNLAVTVFGDTTLTAPCGPQLSDTLLNNMFSAVDAEQGMLYASRDFLGFEFRTKRSLHNQPAITLNYANDMLKTFKPKDDDRYRANKVTARRKGGSQATYEVTTGANSTQEPPNGVGEYEEDLTWLLYTDSQLPVFASYRALLGSWDGIRLSALGVWAQRTEIAGDQTGVFSDIGRIDLGEFIDVTSPPNYLPPDNIESIVQGYDELLANFEWQINWTVVPSGPYRVFILGDASYGRLQAAASTTSGSFSAGVATALTVVSPKAVFTNADVPFDIMVSGTRLHVTNVAGTTSPQVLTVDAAPVNGVVKTVPSGSTVKVIRPAILG